MINTKILKSDFNSEQYVELAAWANENGAFIKEYEDYYICEEEPTPSATEIKKTKIAEIKAIYEEKFKTYESALMRARLAGNDAAVAKLQEVYKSDMAAMMSEMKGV